MIARDVTAMYVRLLGLIRLFRPFNAVAVVASFVCGYFFAVGEVPEVYIWYGIAALFFAHSATTLQNDVYDAAIDKDNKRTGLLQTDHLRLEDAKKIVLYMSIMALAVVALTNKKYDMALWVLGYLFLGWVYNAPPLRLSVRPFASVFTLGVYYAALPFLFGVFLTGSVHTNVLIFGAGLFLQRAATSILKDYKDAKGDALHGKKRVFVYRWCGMCAWGALPAA